MKTVHKIVMALLAAMTMVCLLVPNSPIQAQEADNPPIASDLRREENFNRSWKFIRRDDPNAIEEDYSDENWYNVSLPHDFSIPYFMEQKFYTGIGWYRKTFEISEEDLEGRVKIDFDGVFHTIDLYVNGRKVGTHQGGYTGFEFDLTDYLHAGENILAAKVDNTWNPQLAPRAGDHNFTGGIYRDVKLVYEAPVHVTWYGTFAQTPNVSKASSDLRMQAEVENESEKPVSVYVRHTLLDAEKNQVAQFASSPRTINAGETFNFDDTYPSIANPHLWSVDDPYLYTVITEVFQDGAAVDSVSTQMGFRWCEWTADQGFFLNGEHLWLNGVNAHQDHAGWCNAVSDSALARDVEMVKEAGFNFIRGSHYPHAPAYTQACDENGIIYWSEVAFWFIGGAGGEGDAENPSSADYTSNGYPTVSADQPAFEQSCMDMLEEMIRVHRNHPSIVVWSMGNETFFQNVQDDSGTNTDVKKRALITRMAKRCKELDPTRAAGLGGTQRNGYDKIEGVEVAGYNGDGAAIGDYQNPGVPNMVAEYGSHTVNRSEGDEYAPYYDFVQSENNLPIEYEWRSGIALWCMFHHGTVAARSYGDMGIVDYYRLPMKEWYWYRNQFNPEHPKPEFSKEGTPTKLELSASDLVLKDDGTQDTHLIVTLKDDEGNWIGEKRKITLTVTEGPGIFPTGKTFVMDPDSENKSMLDGKGAIEFRSYYAGTTTITAESEGLEPATITLTTVGDSMNESEPDISTMYGSFMNTDGIILTDIENASAYELRDLNGVPCNASSNEEDRQNVLDKDPNTSWTASVPGPGQYINATMEHGEVILYKAAVLFDGEKMPFTLQGRTADATGEDDWETIVSYDKETIQTAPEEMTFFGTNPYRYIRVLFDQIDDDQYASFAELKLYSLKSVNEPIKTGYSNLSDLDLPEMIIKNKTVDGRPLTSEGIRYAKGISIPSTSTLTIDNYTKETGGYAWFEAEAFNASSNSVTLRLSAKNQTIYEKSFAPGEAASLKLSVYRCPDLTIETEGAGSISLGDARFSGVRRNLSLNQESIAKAEYLANYETLVPGTSYEGLVDLKAKEEQTVEISTSLVDPNGALLDFDSRTMMLAADKQTEIPVSVSVPKNLTDGSVLRVMIWNKETLEVLCDSVYAATLIDAKGQPAEADKYPAPSALELPKVTAMIGGNEMTKTGNWGRWPASGTQAGTLSGYETYVETGDYAGAELSYTFIGSAVSVFAKKDGSQSGCKIYIDGELADTISTNVSDGSNSYPSVFTKTFEEEGEHTIRIVPTGKFGFDALQILRSGIASKPEYVPGTENVTVAGSDVSVIKGGDWGQWKISDSEGYETYTDKAGSTLSYDFTGTGISMITKFDGGKTGADLYIDGKFYGTVSCTESSNTYRKGIDIQSLPFGAHTFSLVTKGKFGFTTITAVYGELEDRTALQAAVEQAEKLNESDYVSGWQNLQFALQDAKLALQSWSFSQDEIDDLCASLLKAIEDLGRPSELLKSSLASSLVKALDTLRTKDYDPHTNNQAAFTTAYDAAAAGVRSDAIEQAETLHENLLAGIAAIQTPEQPAFDLSALQMAVRKGEQIKENLSAYSNTGVSEFETALASAKSVLDDPRSQDEIDQSAKALASALLVLRRLPDASDSIFS